MANGARRSRRFNVRDQEGTLRVPWPPKSFASTSIFPPASGMSRRVTSLFSGWPFAFLSNETLALYGLDQDVSKNIGAKCLMARRLIERGVRFVQV